MAARKKREDLMRSFLAVVLVTAVTAISLVTAVHAQSADDNLSPEQRAAKKNAQVNQAYEQTIKNTAPIVKPTPNNDPWKDMRSPTPPAGSK
jgi:flagellar basal body-associated protein FliL